MARARSSPGLLLLYGAISVHTAAYFATQEQQLLFEAEAISPWLTHVRRELHKIPELRYEEFKTSAFIRAELDKLGVAYRHPIAKTGIVATLGSGQPPRIALRGDMDCLAIQEQVDSPFKSTHADRMCACGHDAHVAMALGAAKLLKRREAEIQGTVLVLFQPAEEGGAGAKMMINEGAVEGVSAAFAIHVWPYIQSGHLLSKEGTLLSATDKFVVKVRGKGGHGGMPHETKDAIVAASMAVVALQPLVSRETDPTDSTIVGVTSFSTGPGSNNIHPDEVELQGTLNAISSTALETLKARFQEAVSGAVALYKCSAQITWTWQAYPPTVNDPQLLGMVREVSERLVGSEKWHVKEKHILGAEDFAFYGGKALLSGIVPEFEREYANSELAEVMPSAYVWLGTGNSSLGTDAPVHTSRFQMDESQMPLGAALHASTALEFLRRHSSSSSEQEL